MKYTIRYTVRNPLDSQEAHEIKRETVIANSEAVAKTYVQDNWNFIDIEEQGDGLPWLDLSETVAIAITPKIARFMEPLVEVAPWDEIPDTVTVTKLPPAKISTLQELADAQAHSVKIRYYGNEGKPHFPHQEVNS